MKTILGAIALLIAFSAGAASLERYKAFLNGTQSARAHFEQKVYDRSGKLTQESNGSFVFQRPGPLPLDVRQARRPGHRRRRPARLDLRPAT